MFLLRDFIEADAKKHDADWAYKIITFVRMYMRPLVNMEHAARGMDYMLNQQDMTPIQNLFMNAAPLNLDNKPNSAQPLFGPNGQPLRAVKQEEMYPEMQGVNFRSLPVMEKIMNMLVAEMKKMGVVVNVRALDPTSTIKRKKDKAIIENQDLLSGMLNYIYTSIGEKPVNLKEYEDRFGEKPTNGNTEEFEKMGMDARDPSDVGFFFDQFHKLDCEIAAQEPIDYVMEVNQVEQVIIENWTRDLTGKKAIAGHNYVSKTDGSQKIIYIAPETVFVYGATGRRKDYNDSYAKCFEQLVTIKEMLSMFGDAFDFNKEQDALFQAINYANTAIEITGIKTDPKSGYIFNGKRTDQTYTYNEFLNFRVKVGYIEWVSQIEEDVADGGPRITPLDSGGLGENNQPGNDKRYQAKAKFEDQTYKCYYLALSSIDCRMFDFGKVTYQQIEGHGDVYSNFTILTYKEVGPSIADNCAPIIDMINECWYKIKYQLRKAKPPGTDYNYSSLLQIAEDIFSDTNIKRGDKIQKVVSWLNASADGIWDWPQIEGEQRAMTSNQINIEKKNGLGPEFMKWWETMDKCWQLMYSVVGLDAPLRQGDPGGNRDSMNNQFKALEYSQNNTYYIPDSITYMAQMLATRSMLYVQDIIQYGDHDTMAYSYLVDAVGEETLNKIGQLGKKAMHRYGIFVESLNQAPMRAKLQARVDLAIQTGKISNAEALLIENIKSPNKAFQTLAYFEQRNKKIEQKNAMQMQQAQAQAQQQQMQMQIDMIKLKGGLDIELEKIRGNAVMQAHLINQQGGMAKQQMKQNADSLQIYQQADADLKAQQANLNTTGQTTPPPPPQFPPVGIPGQPTQGPPQPERPPSAIQQQLQETQPAPTSI